MDIDMRTRATPEASAIRGRYVPLTVAALAGAAVTAALASRLTAMVSAWTGPDAPDLHGVLRTARIEDMVEVAAVLTGTVLGLWFSTSLAAAAACAVARSAGRRWAAGERLVARAAPMIVRRALVVTAGTSVALAGAGLPAFASTTPSPPTDLGWAATMTSESWTGSSPEPVPHAPAGAADAAVDTSAPGPTSPTSPQPARESAPRPSAAPEATAPSPTPARPASSPRAVTAPTPTRAAGTAATAPAGVDARAAAQAEAREAPRTSTSVGGTPGSTSYRAPVAAPPAWNATPAAVPDGASSGAGATASTTPRSDRAAPSTAASAPTDAPVTAPAMAEPSGPAATAARSVGTTPPGSPTVTGSVAARAAAITVLPGDTLWGIAAEHLAADASVADVAAAWPAWYAANVDVIGPDPGHIIPGQVLHAPPDVTGDAATTGARP